MRAKSNSSALTFELSATTIEAIAERAADIVAERQAADDDCWIRGADKIAGYLDCPRSRVYALASCKPARLPIEHDGASLIARRSDLDRWIRNGGGVRP